MVIRTATKKRRIPRTSSAEVEAPSDNLPYGMMHVCPVLYDAGDAAQSSQSERASYWVVRIHNGKNSSNEFIHREYFVQMLFTLLHDSKYQKS